MCLAPPFADAPIPYLGAPIGCRLVPRVGRLTRPVVRCDPSIKGSNFPFSASSFAFSPPTGATKHGIRGRAQQTLLRNNSGTTRSPPCLLDQLCTSLQSLSLFPLFSLSGFPFDARAQLAGRYTVQQSLRASSGHSSSRQRLSSSSRLLPCVWVKMMAPVFKLRPRLHVWLVATAALLLVVTFARYTYDKSLMSYLLPESYQTPSHPKRAGTERA